MCSEDELELDEWLVGVPVLLYCCLMSFLQIYIEHILCCMKNSALFFEKL